VRGHRGPWSGRQVAATTAANAVAVTLAAAAWWVTSGMDTATSQVRWSSIGLIGVVIALAANSWFLAQGRQGVRVAHRAVFAQPCFAPSAAGTPATNGSHSSPVRSTASGDGYLSVPGTVRYHRPTCSLVARKNVDEAPRSVHEQSGRKACEVCEP
jgi:hypothetical protein